MLKHDTTQSGQTLHAGYMFRVSEPSDSNSTFILDDIYIFARPWEISRHSQVAHTTDLLPIHAPVTRYQLSTTGTACLVERKRASLAIVKKRRRPIIIMIGIHRTHWLSLQTAHESTYSLSANFGHNLLPAANRSIRKS